MENIGLSGAPGSTWFGMRSPELAWWVGTADCIYPENPGHVGLYRDTKVICAMARRAAEAPSWT